jgi:hypothetical protein
MACVAITVPLDSSTTSKLTLSLSNKNLPNVPCLRYPIPKMEAGLLFMCVLKTSTTDKVCVARM